MNHALGFKVTLEDGKSNELIKILTVAGALDNFIIRQFEDLELSEVYHDQAISWPPDRLNGL
jgi:hypothetical protein